MTTLVSEPMKKMKRCAKCKKCQIIMVGIDLLWGYNAGEGREEYGR